MYCLYQRVLIEVFDDAVFIRVGNGDEFIAKDDAEAVDLLNFCHVYNVRTVYSEKFWPWQIVLHLFHAHEAHNLLAAVEMNAQIVNKIW